MLKKFVKSLGFMLKRPLYVFLFFMIIVSLLYINTVINKYTLDDNFVVNDKTAQGISAIPDIFTSKYVIRDKVGQAYGYRPIVLSFFAAEATFFGQSASVSHGVNLLLYLFTAFLLYYLLLYFWGDENQYIALLTTLLFIVLPVHTEVVASAKSRDELLAFLFALLSWHTYKQFINRHQTMYVPLAAILFLCACMSKPTMIPLTLLIPFSFYWFGKANKKQVVTITLSLLLMFVTMYGLNNLIDSQDNIAGRTFLFFENPLFYDKNILHRTATGFYCLAKYLQLLIFPQHLLYYYGYNQIPIVDWHNWVAITSLLFHVGLLIGAFVYRKNRILSFGILYYLANIAMFANIVKPGPGIIAERFLYIGSLGFCIVLAYVFVQIYQRYAAYRKITIATIAFVYLLFGARTIIRNGNWYNDLTLFSHDMPQLQQSFKANMLYASALVATKNATDLPLAEKHYKQALLIYDKYYIVWNNLGYLHLLQNRPNDALTIFERALQINPNAPEVTYNIAQTAELLQDIPKAISFYQKTIQLNPKAKQSEEAFTKLHQIFTIDNNVAAIIQNLQQAIQYYPKNLQFYDYLATTYYANGQQQQAINVWETIFALVPQNQTLIFKLARANEELGNTEKAAYYNNLIKK
jgi:tetratricopeptide (TPR) repeat protein